ncbi:MAG: dihydroorotase, multifunctional complex type [Osedax symbiont Rs2]|nr:MAG: dihydroorotase, multifunctional complex type [Osedax symbiont Rs2]
MIKITNGRLIDPANDLDTITDLYLDLGVVTAIGAQPAEFDDTTATTIDASGKIVCPGLIDLSVHLREPGYTHKASIASETKAAASAGITTVVCPPTTKPVIDSTAVAELIQDRANACGKAKVLPVGALSLDLQGEKLAPMSALANSGCIAFSNARATIGNSQALLRCLEYAATHDFLVIFNPQDNSLVANGVLHEGSTSTNMGLTGIPEAAETIEVARSLILIEQSGVRAHFGQLSCERSISMITQARSKGLPVTADVAIAHFFFTDENAKGFNSMFHLQPPLRSQLDRAGLLNALVTGEIQAICSDHQPHEEAAKHAPFAATEAGISGLETLLPLGLQLVEQGLIDLPQLIEKLTCAPAKILNIAAGSLAVGDSADITIFDQNHRWLLEHDSLVSAGKNTPLIGSELTGRVTHTLLAGHLVYSL